MKWFFTSVLVLLISFQGWTVDLTKVDFSHQYDGSSPIRFDHRLMLEGNVFQMAYKVTNLWEDSLRLKMDFFLQENYKDTVEKALEGHDLVMSASYEGQLAFEQDTSYKLLVVKISDLKNGGVFFHDIVLESVLNFQFTSFIPIDMDTAVLFTPYVDERNSIRFSSPGITAYRYINKFPAGKPPMSKRSPGPKTLEIDSTISVRDQFNPERGHFYFFQDDTTGVSGIGLLGVTPLYPKLISLKEIIKPLVYISTGKEYEAIVNAQNPKTALDRFLLDVTGDQKRAVNTIKRFFARVKGSNNFFTTYKEGWKTDRGMIFLIFGPPERVEKSALYEKWFYSNRPNTLEFSFSKVKNLFTPFHYVLDRKEDYRESWFQQVDLWRKGRI